VRTDELIVHLARSAKPLRLLAPAGVRATRWFAAALLIVGLAMMGLGPRADLVRALGGPVFLGSLVVLLLTMACGAWAAFVLSVPGAARSPAQHVLPALTAMAWPVLWLGAWSTAAAPAGPGTDPIHWGCAIQIVVCATAAGSLLVAMLVRAAPLRPLWTSAVAATASTAAGAVAAQVLCPIDDLQHQLIGHVLIAVLVAAAGLLPVRRALDFRRP
jgi:hypothetical protein